MTKVDKKKDKTEFKVAFKKRMYRMLYPKDAKEILSITWHIFIQLFIAAIIAQINILLFTWYDGKSYYAVMSKITIMFTTFQFIPSLIASGVLVVGGNLIGQKRHKELPIVISTGLLVNALICLVIVGILEGVSPYLLSFQKAIDAPIGAANNHLPTMYPEASELDFATKYFRIQITQLFIMAFAQVYIAGLQVIRKQKHIMISGIVSNIVDVFIVSCCLYWWKVDPIYTALSIPIGNFVQLIYIGIISYKFIGYRVDKNIHESRINWKFLKEIVRIGVPMTAEIALWYGCNFVTQAAIAGLHTPDGSVPDTYIELNRTLNAIDQYSYTFLQAIATTTSILVAKKVGEMDKNGAYESALDCWRIAVYAQAILSTLVMALLYPLLLAYNTDPNLIVKYGYLLWLTVMVKILGDTVNLSLLRALWTVGDLWWPLIISIFSMLIGMVALPWVVTLTWKGDTGYGLVLIFAVLMLDPSIRSIIYIKMWLSKKWMKYVKKVG